MTILDSSVWISFLLADDSRHDDARKAVSAVRGVIHVPESIIDEVCTVLSVRCKRKDIADEFAGLLSAGGKAEVLHSNPEFFESVLALYRQIHTHTLSFTDVVLLTYSTEHAVVTFDVQLRSTILRTQRLP